MKNIEIKETNRGFYVKKNGQEYTYGPLEILLMLEEIGKELVNRPVKVVER